MFEAADCNSFKLSLLQVLNADICKGKKFDFFKLPPGNLLKFYQLTNFVALICNSFHSILITKFLIFNTFEMPKFPKGNTLKYLFFKFSPGVLLINLYQLTKFIAPCFNRF